MEALDKAVGLDPVAVFHVNDSKRAKGSRVDRHAHLGAGHIGEAGFRHLLADSRFTDRPMILETPESERMHSVNLQRMQKWSEKEKRTG